MSRYKVWHAANMSDESGVGYFAVKGARVNEFAVCKDLAVIMQRALNNRFDFTPRQWKVIRQSLSAHLMGVWSEGDLCWTQADHDAAQAVVERI